MYMEAPILAHARSIEADPNMAIHRNTQVLAVARRRWQMEAAMARAWVKRHHPKTFAKISKLAEQKQAQMHPEIQKVEEKNGK